MKSYNVFLNSFSFLSRVEKFYGFSMSVSLVASSSSCQSRRVLSFCRLLLIVTSTASLVLVHTHLPSSSFSRTFVITPLFFSHPSSNFYTSIISFFWLLFFQKDIFFNNIFLLSSPTRLFLVLFSFAITLLSINRCSTPRALKYRTRSSHSCMSFH